jgi:hypothetical protein
MLFGHETINTERLTVPHYDMKNRGFMLWPLYEVAPSLTFPDGLSLKAVLNSLGAEKPALVRLFWRLTIKYLWLIVYLKSLFPRMLLLECAKIRFWAIRKQYETNHHLLTAEMQTGKNASPPSPRMTTASPNCLPKRDQRHAGRGLVRDDGTRT